MFEFINMKENLDNKKTNYRSSTDDKSLFFKRVACKALCYKYNSISPNMVGLRIELLRKILGKTKSLFLIEQPFMCDYGCNISVGENFYANHNLLILDSGKVIFGDDVLVGPNCSFYTTSHPLEPELRKFGLEESKSIVIGNNVWIGGNVTVLPGVKIGENSVIGASSVVSKDIPSNVLAVGNPCKIIKDLK